MTKENDSDNITSLRVERTHRTLKTKQQCNPEKFQEKISERLERDKPNSKERTVKISQVDFDWDQRRLRNWNTGS